MLSVRGDDRVNESFVRERITQLRLRKGVSEYQMSYGLGHSRGYIYNISSGKALPPMKEFVRASFMPCIAAKAVLPFDLVATFMPT